MRFEKFFVVEVESDFLDDDDDFGKTNGRVVFAMPLFFSCSPGENATASPISKEHANFISALRVE